MAQRTKIQDGIVSYSTNDPISTDINFNIEGRLNISKEINIGNGPLIDGNIISPGNTDIIIASGKNLGVQTPNGNIILNNMVWPNGTVTPVPGMYLGVSATNTLQFYNLPSTFAPYYQYFTSTTSQTVFNTSVSTIANGSGRSYLQIFVNGIKQIEGATRNYQVTGPNQVTFNTGLSLNDKVEFYAYS